MIPHNKPLVILPNTLPVPCSDLLVSGDRLFYWRVDDEYRKSSHDGMHHKLFTALTCCGEREQSGALMHGRHLSRSITSCVGQALVEGMVLVLVLISFFIAIPWLGRLFDIGMQQMHASRYAAFQWSRQLQSPDEKKIKHKFLLSNEHQWRDRRHQRIVTAESINMRTERQIVLDDDKQPGKQVAQAATLRRQWGLQDQGVVNIKLAVSPIYTGYKQNSSTSLGLDAGFLERLPLTIYRNTAILVDAGHSDSDKTSHYRTGQSDLAWQEVAERSYALGKHIQRYAEPAEGFARENPIFDWLLPWAGKLPKHHLESLQEK